MPTRYVLCNVNGQKVYDGSDFKLRPHHRFVMAWEEDNGDRISVWRMETTTGPQSFPRHVERLAEILRDYARCHLRAGCRSQTWAEGKVRGAIDVLWSIDPDMAERASELFYLLDPSLNSYDPAVVEWIDGQWI